MGICGSLSVILGTRHVPTFLWCHPRRHAVLGDIDSVTLKGKSWKLRARWIQVQPSTQKSFWSSPYPLAYLEKAPWPFTPPDHSILWFKWSLKRLPRGGETWRPGAAWIELLSIWVSCLCHAVLFHLSSRIEVVVSVGRGFPGSSRRNCGLFPFLLPQYLSSPYVT